MEYNKFNGKLSGKEFANEIKDCKIIELKDFTKEIVSESVDEKDNSTTTIIKVEGCFKGTMKKVTKTVANKDSISELISKEFEKINSGLETILKEIKVDIAELKQDVAELKQDVAELKHDVAELKHDVEILKHDVADIKIRVSNLEQDVADIKKCPTIRKELAALK